MTEEFVGGQDLCLGGKEPALILDVDGDDAGLQVHAEDGGAGGVER